MYTGRGTVIIAVLLFLSLGQVVLNLYSGVGSPTLRATKQLQYLPLGAASSTKREK